MIYNNSDKLKRYILEISKGDSIKSQTLLRKFFMDSLLYRIHLSKYNNNFILKGGMLVSTILGIEYRSTRDIDVTISNFILNEENIRNIIREICEININDYIKYEVKNIEYIMEDHNYTGYRITIKAFFENINDVIKIDISTGDIIYPEKIEYGYTSIFFKDKFNIFAYNIETVLAEKIETILSRSIANTRMRDYYDVYIIYEYYNNINKEILLKAIEEVMKQRQTENLLITYENIINELTKSDEMNDKWQKFVNKTFYVKEINFKTILEIIKKILCKTPTNI